MEWVETTAKTIDEAKSQALDQLGVGDDDAEFEIVEEPRAGLFGLIRGEARVRARVRPTAVRPKQDRRRGRRERGAGDDTADEGREPAAAAADDAVTSPPRNGDRTRRDRPGRPTGGTATDRRRDGERPRGDDGAPVTASTDPVDPAAVGDAAVRFMDGLVAAFGFTGTTTVAADGTDLEVRVDGEGLGLLIGPGGRTLLAVQDIARVAAQRRLGDHDTRLRVDVAGYRERRRVALEKFARSVAQQVLDSGVARAMEPMPSADRKIVHDALATLDGVSSRSEGDDPARRVIVSPA